jgi:hypothetical protein
MKLGMTLWNIVPLKKSLSAYRIKLATVTGALLVKSSNFMSPIEVDMVASVLSESSAWIKALAVRKENVKQCTITVRIFFVKYFMVR